MSLNSVWLEFVCTSDRCCRFIRDAMPVGLHHVQSEVCSQKQRIIGRCQDDIDFGEGQRSAEQHGVDGELAEGELF